MQKILSLWDAGQRHCVGISDQRQLDAQSAKICGNAPQYLQWLVHGTMRFNIA